MGENTDPWFAKIQNLVLSLRHFGESLADAPVVVNFVNGAQSRYVEALADLDATVRVVEPLDLRQPSANKLRMLDLGDSYEFDVLLMLDCDVIIRGDAGTDLNTTDVCATPAGKSHLTDAAWRRLYGELNIPLPGQRYTMTFTGKSSYPYFNTGVLSVPRASCPVLFDHWSLQLGRVLDLAKGNPALSAFRKDQIPFACALASANLSVCPLPLNLNLNLSTDRRRVAAEYRGQWGPPFVIHYHRSINGKGFLGPSPNPEINGYLDDFNVRRAGALDIDYPGMPEFPDRLRRRRALARLPGFWSLKRTYKQAQAFLKRLRYDREAG